MFAFQNRPKNINIDSPVSFNNKIVNFSQRVLVVTMPRLVLKELDSFWTRLFVYLVFDWKPGKQCCISWHQTELILKIMGLMRPYFLTSKTILRKIDVRDKSIKLYGKTTKPGKSNKNGQRAWRKSPQTVNISF